MKLAIEMIRQIGDLQFVNGLENPTEVTLGEVQGVGGCEQEDWTWRVLLDQLSISGVITPISSWQRWGTVALTRKGEELYHLYSR